MNRRGIAYYGAYVPYARLQRAAIGNALGAPVGRGTRSVASYDEDTTSMAVEAGRIALAGRRPRPSWLLFATANPAYQDKTNATAIAAALALGPDVLAADTGGAVRSGAAAMLAAVRGTDSVLVLLSDIRTGLPGSADERDGGDAAAAFVVASETESPLVAEYLGGASASEEFLDRWRAPGEARSRVWEERFGESRYVRLGLRALERGLESTGLTLDELDRVIVAGPHRRALQSFIKKAKLRSEQLVDDLSATVGNSGTAHAGLLLASALDSAQSGEVVAVLVLADGADAMFFRTTPALLQARSARPVARQVAAGRAELSYAAFLTWREQLEMEPPRRPAPDPPAAPPATQHRGWKFAFEGSRCECGQRHLPPQRTCVSCGRVDQMEPERLSDVPATVATYTVDHLAYSMSPPLIAAVLDFDGGGRFACELTDLTQDDVSVGTRVEMTFRRLYTSGGVHNYFWKARPVKGEVAE